MQNENKTTETTGNNHTVAESIQGCGAEVYEKAKHAVTDAYDKTAHGITDSCNKARSYTRNNPGTTIIVAMGVGVGLGLLLGTRTQHVTHTNRYARPMVNALSDMALGFFR